MIAATRADRLSLAAGPFIPTTVTPLPEGEGPGVRARQTTPFILEELSRRQGT